MKYGKRLLVLLLAGAMVAGCGRGEDGSGGSSAVPGSGSGTEVSSADSSSAGDSSDGSSSAGEDQKKESSEQASGEENDSSEKGSADGTDSSDKQQSQPEDPVKEPEEDHLDTSKKKTEKSKVYVEKSRFKAGKTIYSDNVRKIKALGLKEYESLKSEGYTDKPAKGKRYLVLFLNIFNGDSEKVFIAPECLTAKVDGESVQNTFLYKDPEGYKTIFKAIEPNEFGEGFIVWEVPENWKKMKLTFTQFELMGGKRLELTMLKKDLKDPEAPSIEVQ